MEILGETSPCHAVDRGEVLSAVKNARRQVPFQVKSEMSGGIVRDVVTLEEDYRARVSLRTRKFLGHESLSLGRLGRGGGASARARRDDAGKLVR